MASPCWLCAGRIHPTGIPYVRLASFLSLSVISFFLFFFLLCLCFFLCSFRPFPAHWVARRLLGRYSLALRPPRYGAVGGGTPYCAARSRPSRRAGLRSCGRVQCLPAIALPLPVLRSGSYRLLCPSVQFSGRARFLIPGTASREAGRQATGRREEGGCRQTADFSVSGAIESCAVTLPASQSPAVFGSFPAGYFYRLNPSHFPLFVSRGEELL